MSQTTTQQRAHRITMPKPTKAPSRRERMEAEAEAREAGARAVRETASLQSAATNSLRIGGPAQTDEHMPNSRDARISTPTLPPASTTTAARATPSPTSTPPGGPGAGMPANTAGRQLAEQTRLPTAAEVVRTAMQGIEHARPLTECLPQPLALLLVGTSETDLGPMETDQVQCPSLTLAITATDRLTHGTALLLVDAPRVWMRSNNLARLGAAVDRMTHGTKLCVVDVPRVWMVAECQCLPSHTK